MLIGIRGYAPKTFSAAYPPALFAGFGYDNRDIFLQVSRMVSAKQAEHSKQELTARIAELERIISNAEQETRAGGKHADPADQAAAEYERQSLAHKATAARQTIRTLSQALERIREGSFGECAQCGADIEAKRLEAIPWARYCVKCQETREQS
jgi:DnaK suppressor protein